MADAASTSIVPGSNYTRLVPAVEQASRVLVCLAHVAPSRLNLTDISARVGIHKSKALAILNTLQAFGFVTRDPDGKLYALGPGLISLSRKALDTLGVRDVAVPLLETLAKETGSSAFFGLIAHDSLFVVAKHDGDQNMGITIRVGQRYPLTHGAHGKAIAAFMPEQERRRLLRHKGLWFHGDPARLDRARLAEELSRCRETGYALDLGSMKQGIHSVAAPVFEAGTKLVGALFVVGTFPRNRAEGFGPRVVWAARELSYLLGAEPQLTTTPAARQARGEKGVKQK